MQLLENHLETPRAERVALAGRRLRSSGAANLLRFYEGIGGLDYATAQLLGVINEEDAIARRHAEDLAGDRMGSERFDQY